MSHLRPQSSDKLNTSFIQDNHIDIIQETRKIIKELSQTERLEKAKKHLEDALAYRTPRPDIYHGDHTLFFKIIYKVQTSSLWSYALYILAYTFMYLVLLDNNTNFNLIISLQCILLTIFWIDIFAQVYHKSYETLRTKSKFQARFYFRLFTLFLLVIDEIIFGITFNGNRPLRIFRILRGFLPIYYDHFIRKAFYALLKAYKDIVVYLVFYALIIIAFGLIANQIIQLPEGSVPDLYTNNYTQLGKAIFVIYVLSTYDAYPDNQHIAIEASLGYYSIFIIFIFLNVLLFVVIPSTLIFNSFRQTRSKIVLIDQIKQQHSLILCFVSLGQDNLNISNKKIIKFLLYVYKQKIRYIDHIAQVCLKLDNNKNHQIVT